MVAVAQRIEVEQPDVAAENRVWDFSGASRNCVRPAGAQVAECDWEMTVRLYDWRRGPSLAQRGDLQESSIEELFDRFDINGDRILDIQQELIAGGGGDYFEALREIYAPYYAEDERVMVFSHDVLTVQVSRVAAASIVPVTISGHLPRDHPDRGISTKLANIARRRGVQYYDPKYPTRQNYVVQVTSGGKSKYIIVHYEPSSGKYTSGRFARAVPGRYVLVGRGGVIRLGPGKK